MIKPSRRKNEDFALGVSALQAGNVGFAREALTKAAQRSPRDPAIRVNLGIALRRMGHFQEAAREFCEALSKRPDLLEAARPLAAILTRFTIDNPGELNPAGLKAALSIDTIERQPIVDVALAHVCAQAEMKDACGRAREGMGQEAACDLLRNRMASVLGNDLLLEALRQGKNTDPDLEYLLTAIRRHVLLHIEPARLYDDRALFPSVLALIAQCDQNEHVWPVTDEEDKALAAIRPAQDDVLGGDIAASWDVCRQLLYRPFGQTAVAGLQEDKASRVKPKALATLIKTALADRERQEDLAAGLKRYVMRADETSAKVRQQYEKSPYPRWTSLQISPPGALRNALVPLFGDAALAFMDDPFDVLVAGCGTGQQLARVASAYGPQARLLGIDLSLTSLAYAKRMCDSFGLTNIDLAQADILDVAALGRTFHVIECVGVLHHMADPFAGWRALVDQLKPGGLMLVGLYSAVSRRNISALRDEPGYPGPGCSDDAARCYRAELMSRLDGQLGSELRQSQDFYSLSEFRDLVLHQSEQQVTLEQIESFLTESGLVFSGFTLDPLVLDDFQAAFPDDPLPGRLENWSKFENDRTTLFDGMYLFWCRKPN